MSTGIHDDEPDTSEPVVRALLASQCPSWSAFRITSLRTSGTTNAMWRLHRPDGGDLVVRLPRRGATISHELDLLEALSATRLPEAVDIPVVRHRGRPDDVFPHHWAVLGWLDGTDAWSARAGLDGDAPDLALDVAEAVHAIGRLQGVRVPERAVGQRGGTIGGVLEQLDRWLHDPRWDAASLVDVAAVERSAAASLEVDGEPVDVGFVHGDLLPGNLLTSGGRLTAVIDWGGAARADLAQDLAPAWAVFGQRNRRAFREAVGASEAAWLRARLFELEHAVGGVLYYAPRRHELGDVMARTLQRILEEG